MDEKHSKLLKDLGKLLKDYFIFTVIIVAALVPFTRDRILNFLGKNIIPDEILVKMTSDEIKSISINFFIAVVIFFILSIIITSIIPYYLKNKLNTKIDELTNNVIDSVGKTKDEGINKVGESFKQGEKSLESINNKYSDSLISLTEKGIFNIEEVGKNGITNINELFNQGKNSLELIRNSIKDELENTANLISAKIDENLYSYSLLKKDMLNSQMIFVYGNFIYLKKPQSNDFLKSAFNDKYWVSGSSTYFVIITQKNEETIINIIEFIKKIKSGIDGYKPKNTDFENFFVGFQNHDLEVPSPIQLVAFLFKNNTYTIKKGLTVSDIEKISFAGLASLPVTNNQTKTQEKIKLDKAINQTLIFSNDLITHNTNIEKQIIGFKIPINSDADKDYEVLKEFDRLKKDITYIKFKDVLDYCATCNNIDSCSEAFINCINNNSFKCENKNS